MSHILTVHKSKSDSHCGDSRLLYIIGICLHNVKNGGTLQIVYCGVPRHLMMRFSLQIFHVFWRVVVCLLAGCHISSYGIFIHGGHIIGRKNMLVFLSVNILIEADFLINEHGGHIADVTLQ